MCELSSELIRVLGLAAGCEALLEEFAFSLPLLDTILFRDNELFIVVCVLVIVFERGEVIDLESDEPVSIEVPILFVKLDEMDDLLLIDDSFVLDEILRFEDNESIGLERDEPEPIEVPILFVLLEEIVERLLIDEEFVDVLGLDEMILLVDTELFVFT